MPRDLPKKLKFDAIVEAVFEARFDAESSLIPEVLFGRLADTPEWREYAQRRLPMADVPAALRRADRSLRYQAAMELVDPQGQVIVRIGPQSLAFVRKAPYPGWEVVGPEISRTIDVLFGVLPAIKVTRLGLRYINALKSDVHQLASVADLNINVVVDAAQLVDSLNLNYSKARDAELRCTVRIATLDFAEGSIPENTSVIVDVDVFTPEPYATSDLAAVKRWTESAHNFEKENFFQLLTDKSIEALRAD